MPPLTVLHIVSGDLWAGAEVMVFTLLSKLRENSNITLIAISLNEGVLTDKLRTLGIEVFVIQEASYSILAIVAKANKLLKKRKIDIIHSHRYKENIISLILGKLIGVKYYVTTIHGLSEAPSNKSGVRR